MPAFRISTETIGGRTVHSLFDDTTGARASVLPSYGFNLFDLRLPAGGEPRAVLNAAADFAADPKNPGRNGTPILFPFPNRIREGAFTFAGKDYKIPANNGPNAIHGFAIAAPWDVLEHKADDHGATIVGAFQISRQAPEMMACWPTDASIKVRYTLAGRRLTLEATIANPTAQDLPYGFGIHPYFHLPLKPGGDFDRTKVIIPASEVWTLVDFLPTGERKPVDSRLDFRAGRSMRDLKLDDVLTGFKPGADHTCRLIDLDLKTEFQLGFDDRFREVVVYTPPNSPGVLAVEPYTQTTDAINLQARGIDAGLRVLKHDQHETLIITMTTRDA